MRSSTLSLILISLLLCSVRAQESDSTAPARSAAPVVLDEDTAFVIRLPLGPFSASERAVRAIENLSLARSAEDFSVDSIEILQRIGASDVVFGSTILFTVTDEDAALDSLDRAKVVGMRLARLRAIIANADADFWNLALLVSAGVTLLALCALVGLFWAFRAIFPRLYTALEEAEGKLIRGIHVRSYELVSTATMGDFLQILARGLRLFLSLMATYIALTVSLDQFDLTRDLGIEPYLFGFLSSILVTAAVIVVFRGVLKFHEWSARRIHGWKGTLIRPVKIKSVEVLSEERIADMFVLSTKFGRFVLFGFLAYFYISTILGLFPLTTTWSETLFGYILTPFTNAIWAFINYIPNLFSIIVILALTHYLLRFLRFISLELGRGALTLPGFYPEWASPTFKIARFLVIVFAAIVVFPYLPGSNSPFFQGISIFVGVLFSLGSSSAISNMVAGVVLTYMRPFQLGHRVKIADTVGDIVEKTLLVTRIRTNKNVDVTIPNAMVLGAHIVNYSSSSENRGLVLHTTVTIGYDAPWRKVHELLLAAADRTENVLKDPKPFVYQTALNDFHVSYELNAYTDDPSDMASTYSALHQSIQDTFSEAGIEIMSPHYASLRDGNDPTTPAGPDAPPARPPKGFRVQNQG